MPTITFEQLEAEVRRLAAENPNYVYTSGSDTPGCFYRNPDDTPGCIFGQALEALGYRIPPARPGHADYPYVGDIAGVMGELNITTTPDQQDWAVAVQVAQDSDDTWASVIDKADHDDLLRR